MFARPYSTVTVHVAGEQPQRWTIPSNEAHDFAADQYAHYRANLGEFTGSRFENGTTFDRFERGSIEIGAAR